MNLDADMTIPRVPENSGTRGIGFYGLALYFSIRWRMRQILLY